MDKEKASFIGHNGQSGSYVFSSESQMVNEELMEQFVKTLNEAVTFAVVEDARRSEKP
jgi:hypothetical protein